MNLRLKTILNNIDSKIGVIDVGTDHGYLPAELALSGYEGNIYASDINEGPLNSAVRSAEDAGVSDKITFLLSDGLSACPRDKVDTVIIAGMGGDLICRILDHAPWVIAPGYQLILQPMTKAEVLRYWLTNNDFIICNEQLVEDGNLYQIITAKYGKNRVLNDAELFTGAFEQIKDEPLFIQELEILKKRFERIVSGLEASNDSDAPGKLRVYRKICSEISEMKEKL